MTSFKGIASIEPARIPKHFVTPIKAPTFPLSELDLTTSDALIEHKDDK